MSTDSSNCLAAVSSPDLNAERLAELKRLLPDLFTNEGLLNVDELKKVVDPALVTESERYDFRWYGKTASKREVCLVRDAHRSALLCLDQAIHADTVDYFEQHKDHLFICLELALETTRKWNLKHHLGDKLKSV